MKKRHRMPRMVMGTSLQMLFWQFIYFFLQGPCESFGKYTLPYSSLTLFSSTVSILSVSILRSSSFYRKNLDFFSWVINCSCKSFLIFCLKQKQVLRFYFFTSLIHAVSSSFWMSSSMALSISSLWIFMDIPSPKLLMRDNFSCYFYFAFS